jgi:PAS domain S-box-containing protein
MAWAFLCVGAAAIALHFVLHEDVAVYHLIGFSSAGAIFLGTAVRRPRIWPAWVLLGVSQLMMASGDVVYDEITSRYPGPADVLYLLAIVVLAAAFVLFAYGSPRGAASANLDAALVTVAIGIAAWALVATEDETGSRIAWLVSAAYPLADIVVIGLGVRLLLAGGRRTPSFWLLLAAILPLFISDLGYVFPSLAGTYNGTTWLDAGWLASYVLFGAAALHPTMVRPIRRTPSASDLSMSRVLVIGAAITCAPLAVVVAGVIGRPVDLYDVSGAITVLVALVVVRFALIVRALHRASSEAVASERKFRLVFERAPIGISVGREGMMSETNPALHRMLGYTAEEFARMRYTDVTYPDDVDLAEQIELDEARRDSFAIDKRYTAKDGTVLDTHVHVARDLDDGLGISLIEDVTERHHLEEQLRHAQKMEAVGKLAGGIAHDFNNLMTAVLGYSDLILGGLDADDANREKIESIREASMRASDLTHQLLAFSRRQMLQTTDVDLREVVARLESLLRRTIGEDVLLETSFCDEPVVVRADPTQLEQVVMNLAVNAREAMPGGGTLKIRALCDGETAVLTVEDTGRGMSAETQQRVFEPFFTTKPVSSGTGSGLGLSTVHGIVGQSGGTVVVESEEGSGTRFTVRLPLSGGKPLLPETAPAATLVD